MNTNVIYKVVCEKTTKMNSGCCSYGIDACGMDSNGKMVSAYVASVSIDQMEVEELVDYLNQNRVSYAAFVRRILPMRNKNQGA